jgi:hypothetical protein
MKCRGHRAVLPKLRQLGTVYLRVVSANNPTPLGVSGGMNISPHVERPRIGVVSLQATNTTIGIHPLGFIAGSEIRTGNSRLIPKVLVREWVLVVYDI